MTDIIRRTHDAFALAHAGRADEARTLLCALRIEAGDEHTWMRVKAAALHRGVFA